MDQSTLDEMKQVCHCSLAVCIFLPLQRITFASMLISCTSTLRFLLLSLYAAISILVSALGLRRRCRLVWGWMGGRKRGASCPLVSQVGGALSIWVTLIAPAQLIAPPSQAHPCPEMA